jgi:diguanylate cyclase (GGDEF)-like protein
MSSLKTSIKYGGDYNRSYRLCLADDVYLNIIDKGTVQAIDGKITMIGTVTTDDEFLRIQKLRQAEATVESSYAEEASTNENALEIYDNAFEKEDFFAELDFVFRDCQNTGGEATLLNVSIDNLQMMITWYSSKFANRVMEALGIQLKKILRDTTIVRRTALDQFSIILQNQSKSEIELVIDRILRKIQLYNNPSFEEPLHLRTSIGSVKFPTYADSAVDTINKAFLALGNAKQKTSEFHCDYLEAKREHLDSKEQVGKLLYMQNAFKEDKVHLAFQPLIESKTGKVASYECLMRVEDDSGRLQSAGALIPIAEKMGYIDIVDEFVLEKIIDELKQYPDIKLAFNVSNLTTDNPKWLQRCTKLLNDPAIATRTIVEITETAAQGDLRQTAYFVAALQATGAQVALDDFGAGYTSFRQLKSLSVDKVKIDGSYIMGLEENSENLLFIKTLLDFNQSYGLETVAECVEDGGVAKILMSLGVDYMQGYYFGKPDVQRPWAGEKRPYEQDQG